jgi:hypothetical protein
MQAGALTVAAAGLFIFGAIRFINLGLVSPDLLGCGLFFVMLALGLKLLSSPSFSVALLLGTVAALGYYARAALLPVAGALLATLLVLAWNERQARSRVVTAAVVCLLLVAPWVAALSVKKGRPLFSDSPRLTIMWHVSGRVVGRRAHGARLIWAEPKVIEFAEPVVGTYPLWRDPSYWTEGMYPAFEPFGHLRQMQAGLATCARMAAELCRGSFLGGLVLVVCVPCLYRRWGQSSGGGSSVTSDRRPLRAFLLLIVPSVGGIVMYCLILVEPRYVCGFVLAAALAAAVETIRRSTGRRSWLAWLWSLALLIGAVWDQPRLVRLAAALSLLGLYVLARLPRLREPRPAWHRLMLGAPFVAFVVLCLYAAGYMASRTDEFAAGLRDRGEATALAEALRRAGVGNAAVVTIGGPAYDWYWLRLARVRVIAEIERPEVERLWRLSEADCNRLFERLACLGARWAISIVEPEGQQRHSWQKLSDRLFVRKLTDPRPPMPTPPE